MPLQLLLPEEFQQRRQPAAIRRQVQRPPELLAAGLADGSGDSTDRRARRPHFDGFLPLDDEDLHYVKGDWRLLRLLLLTLTESVLYEVPEDFVSYGTWVANSARNKVVVSRSWQSAICR
jgi:hypothetical protein